MDNYTNCYNCDYSLVSGNSLDVNVNYCQPEIRADVVVHEYKSVRLWGRIINCDGEPVANALIKLLQVVYCNGHYTYKGIAHTVSDCEGFYQFDVGNCDNGEKESCYKILVSKACYGPEKVIPINDNNCNPCDECEPCNPCNSENKYPNDYAHFDDCDHMVVHNNSDKSYNTKPGCKCTDNNPLNTKY